MPYFHSMRLDFKLSPEYLFLLITPCCIYWCVSRSLFWQALRELKYVPYFHSTLCSSARSFPEPQIEPQCKQKQHRDNMILHDPNNIVSDNSWLKGTTLSILGIRTVTPGFYTLEFLLSLDFKNFLNTLCICVGFAPTGNLLFEIPVSFLAPKNVEEYKDWWIQYACVGFGV